MWFPIKSGFWRRTSSYVKAVDGVSLALRKGQTLAVVGESGSGKTTLGLALLRLIRSQGPILYLGKNIDGLNARQMRPLRRHLQIVFQDPYGSLSPRMSVAEIVEEGLVIQDKGLSAPSAEPSSPARWPTPASTRRPWTATRMNFPAASASASPSPVPWRSIPR